ncbi:MAG: hypothetical protein M3071_17375 [Actinomycetota bacterium]|nr:hypothetical protein [Actinomycetota bacterium]
MVYTSFLGSTRYLGRYPNLSGAEITAMTIATVFLAELSILLHEFGHTFQARREGLRADKITLWGLGGVSWNSGPASPGSALRLTAAGPLVSALLAVLLGGLGWLARRVGLPTSVVGIAVLLAQFNAVILVFNLLPMVPMDGGRLLHAALWRLRGLAFATAWASRVGIVLASAVIALGAILPFLAVSVPGVSANPGLSLMITGVIMLWMTLSYRSAARGRPTAPRELRLVDLVEAAPPPDVPGPNVTIARFLEGATGSAGYGTAASAVIDGGRTVGTISRGLAGLVPADQRERTAVAAVMLRKEDAVVLRRETPIAEAFRTLQAASGRGVLLDRGRVTTIILISDLADVLLQLKDAARGAI